MLETALEALAGWVRQMPLPRLLVAFAVLGVPVLMGEMGYLHYRGNWHRWPMYIPVVVPPIFATAGGVLLLLPTAWTFWLFGAASLLLLATGGLGFFFHAQGIGRQTGGFTLENVMVGPPAFAPLGFSMLGALGLVALAYWGA